MATIPENMNEDRICFLANEIAKTFMQGQGKFITGTEDFIKTYLDVYENAIVIAANRELKNNNKDTVSLNDFAFVPEKMSEDRVCFLANEIAKTFMQGKFITGTEDFIKTYMDVYDAARNIIADRELKKSNKGDNMSSNGSINDLAETLHHSTL